MSEVCSNFRKIKGRARVFVKFADKVEALNALRRLKSQFDDLDVANCCQKDPTTQITIPMYKDGTFSVRFKNTGPFGEIFTKQELFQVMH